MLNLATVTQDIESWIENFVEVPHAALGGWAPCPYARKARLDRDYEICLGQNPQQDARNISVAGLTKSVVIFVYSADQFDCVKFAQQIQSINTEWLVPQDLIALGDHPDDLEVVNGVAMNQGTYTLMMVQKLSDLNSRAKLLADKNFYHGWNSQYLTELFAHRQDPRS
jgi:hypothetical protein